MIALKLYQMYTQKILQEKEIKQVLLVTSAMHMPRSLASFKKQGIKAIPAPTDFLISDRNFTEVNYSKESKMLSFIPDTESLDRTTQAIKEYVGTVIYHLRGWL